MKELVAFLASALVDDPASVQASEEEQEDGLLVELRVAKDDLGKVIGRQGRTAKAMRTLLSAAAARGDRKVRLEIAE